MTRLLTLLLAVCLLPFAAQAQRIPSHCIALADNGPPVRLAGLSLAEDEVAISYVGHSMYRIETHGDLSVVTDYSGGALDSYGQPPDVVTMNNSHTSHFTDYPSPATKHVLRGWGQNGARADIHLDLGEMLIRNVTTDRRGYGGVVPDGNSIFIFEVAGLCIGHFGHLHHEPSDEQYALMGRLDVVMAPVDGGMTLDLPTMIKVLKRVRASIVLPMHWWGNSTLDQFLAGMRDEFVIEELGPNGIVVSRDTLPLKPTVKVMRPTYGQRVPG
jgi:L-ascorbate metabolism protein UlaG (beta-lactamase superfamily)